MARYKQARVSKKHKEEEYNQRQSLPQPPTYQPPTLGKLKPADHEEIISLTESWLVLFSRVNSLISGREINCSSNSEVGIAATDGSSVFFNTQQLQSLFQDAVQGGFNKESLFRKLIEFRGLNYHELSHVLWTPRKSQKVFRDIVEADNTHPFLKGSFFKAWNILEDQRIESLFVAKYPASVPYFKSIIAKYITHGRLETNTNKEADEKQSMWVLLYGRKYLPLEIRLQTEAMFQLHYKVSDKDIKSLKKIVDTYRAIIFPRDASEAFKLVEQFASLLQKIFPIGGIPEGISVGRHSLNEGQVDSLKEQKQSQKLREQADKDLEKEDKNASDSKEKSDDDSDDDSDDKSSDDSDEKSDDDDGAPSNPSENSDVDSGSEGEGEGEGDDSEEDSSPQNENHSDSDSQGKSVRQTGQVRKPSQSEVTLQDQTDQMLEASSNEVGNEIKKQIKQMRKSISDNRFKRFFDRTTAPHHTSTPPVAYRALSNTISQSLAKLKADKDNQWDKGVSTGKFNYLRQVESRGLHFDIFDQWVDEGDERPDAEIVILLDTSSSMQCLNYDYKAIQEAMDSKGERLNNWDMTMHRGNALIDEASCAMWAIKLACQNQEIPCTVIGYDDYPHALLTESDSVSRGQIKMFGAKGSTSACQSIMIADQVLSKSDAKYKLLVTITDGEWADEYESSKVVADMNKRGIKSLLVCLANGYEIDEKANKVKPQYPSGILQPQKRHIGTYTEGIGYGSAEVEVPKGYGFAKMICVENCKSLTKHIGDLLVKGVVNNH